MDILFTFEDGSEYLMHHGIKGMKWGQWNPETAARYSAEGKGASAGGGGGAVDDEEEEKGFFETMKENYEKGKQIREEAVQTWKENYEKGKRIREEAIQTWTENYAEGKRIREESLKKGKKFLTDIGFIKQAY